MSNDSKSKYTLTLKNDNTLKQLFDRYYLIPQDVDLDKRIVDIIKKKSLSPTDLKVKEGANGYILFRKTKKFNQEQQEQIRKDKELSQRQLAKKYNCSVATINKILNNKY